MGKFYIMDTNPIVPKQHSTLPIKCCKTTIKYINMSQSDNNFTLYSQNGALSALPHVCMYFASFPASFAADWLISSGHFSIINVRRIMTLIGVGGPALSFAWIAFAGCARTQECGV